MQVFQNGERNGVIGIQSQSPRVGAGQLHRWESWLGKSKLTL